MAGFVLKRVYDPPAAGDGARVLVDRLWPRGLSKTDAALDLWAKTLAPSAKLRRWYSHQPERWDQFRAHYLDELARPEAQADIAALRDMARKRRVTLLFAARDVARNNAVVLRDFLRSAAG
jgi:uncharacterized protein YeaO (DUF488 family)